VLDFATGGATAGGPLGISVRPGIYACFGGSNFLAFFEVGPLPEDPAVGLPFDGTFFFPSTNSCSLRRVAVSSSSIGISTSSPLPSRLPSGNAAIVCLIHVGVGGKGDEEEKEEEKKEKRKKKKKKKRRKKEEKKKKKIDLRDRMVALTNLE